MERSFRFSTHGEDDLRILWEDGQRVYCRGWRRAPDGSRNPVLAVLPAAEHPTPSLLESLAHEYALKDELDGVWVVRPLALVQKGGRTVPVLEDPGGEPLERLLGMPMAIGRFLRLAIGIVTPLSRAHRQGLIHKDVKPANIWVNCADRQVRLTGFGIASRLPELVSIGPRAPSELLTNIVANGTTSFLIIVAMTFGLILPRMLCERFLPAPAPQRRFSSSYPMNRGPHVACYYGLRFAARSAAEQGHCVDVEFNFLPRAPL